MARPPSAPSTKLNVLIVYWNHAYPIRATIQDHLYSFRRYSKHRCYYLNLAARSVPAYLRRTDFDLIVFHTIFLSCRWNPKLFAVLREKAAPLKRFDALKVALPQDEFIYTEILSDFINDFDVDVVFSVSPESEWQKIYASVNRRKVKFHTVLTGYLDERTIQRINQLAQMITERTIDVGYRAWHAAPWLGRHGLLKVKIVDLIREKAATYRVKIDVSTEEKDTLLGDDWYEFLLRCKYTIGVEGGASILDKDGSIKRRTEQFLALKPGATFEEIEAACFPGLDGSFDLKALSPRHLEACATKTCQVLVEGRYNGALVAGEHYIELKRDFTNADVVMSALKDEKLRETIIERAYRDIVESGRYTYREFVSFIIKQSLVRAAQPRVSSSSPRLVLIFCLMWLTDTYVWFHQSYIAPLRSKLRLRTRLHGLLVRTLPDPVLFVLRRLWRAIGV